MGWQQNFSWFVEVWLEQDGREVNREKIMELSSEIEHKNIIYNAKKEHLESQKQTVLQMMHMKTSNNINEKMQILLFGTYSNKTIVKLLEVLNL